jgi:low affinity Fe/Cu permease
MSGQSIRMSYTTGRMLGILLLSTVAYYSSGGFAMRLTFSMLVMAVLHILCWWLYQASFTRTPIASMQSKVAQFQAAAAQLRDARAKQVGVDQAKADFDKTYRQADAVISQLRAENDRDLASVDRAHGLRSTIIGSTVFLLGTAGLCAIPWEQHGELIAIGIGAAVALLVMRLGVVIWALGAMQNYPDPASAEVQP